MKETIQIRQICQVQKVYSITLNTCQCYEFTAAQAAIEE